MSQTNTNKPKRTKANKHDGKQSALDLAGQMLLKTKKTNQTLEKGTKTNKQYTQHRQKQTKINFG